MRIVIRYIPIVAAAAGFLYLLAGATLLLVSFVMGVGYLPGSTVSWGGGYALGAFLFFVLYGPPIFFLFARNTKETWKRKAAHFLLTAETLLLLYAWTIPNRNPKFCESCDFIVGGIDLSKEKLTDSDISLRFGKGCRQTSRGWPAARLYHFPQAGASMLLGKAEFYNHIKIFKSPAPSADCTSLKELGAFGTSKGINLGDSEDKLFETYGSPRERNNITPKGVELMYAMPGKTMYFGVIDRKIEYIEVGVSE